MALSWQLVEFILIINGLSDDPIESWPEIMMLSVDDCVGLPQFLIVFRIKCIATKAINFGSVPMSLCVFFIFSPILMKMKSFVTQSQYLIINGQS